jgi:hypothetical protein
LRKRFQSFFAPIPRQPRRLKVHHLLRDVGNLVSQLRQLAELRPASVKRNTFLRAEFSDRLYGVTQLIALQL